MDQKQEVVEWLMAVGALVGAIVALIRPDIGFYLCLFSLATVGLVAPWLLKVVAVLGIAAIYRFHTSHPAAVFVPILLGSMLAGTFPAFLALHVLPRKGHDPLVRDPSNYCVYPITIHSYKPERDGYIRCENCGHRKHDPDLYSAIVMDSYQVLPSPK